MWIYISLKFTRCFCFIFFHSVHGILWTASRVGFSNTQVWEKPPLVELHNKSSHKTGEMPMAALRDQLDRAALLFLMCSAYTAMSHHTSPGSLHTISSFFFFCPSGLAFISCSAWLNTSTGFKWASGRTTHLLTVYCFYWLRQLKSLEWDTWRGNRDRGVRYCAGGTLCSEACQ